MNCFSSLSMSIARASSIFRKSALSVIVGFFIFYIKRIGLAGIEINAIPKSGASRSSYSVISLTPLLELPAEPKRRIGSLREHSQYRHRGRGGQ